MSGPGSGVLLGVILAGLAAGGVDPDAGGLAASAAVQPGQRGVVRTVLQDDRLEEIPLEILGISPGFAGPGRDVIVARLEGPRAIRYGVVAGMSGSPVTVEGRLIGALAYRIGGFTPEAIAGITPIEQMRRIPVDDTRVETGGMSWSAVQERLAAVAGVTGMTPASRSVLPAAGPSTTPLAVTGLTPLAREHVMPVLARMGLGPAIEATATGGSVEPRALAGGDPVAVVLVRGDTTVAGTGSVTLVEGDHVLAFGHPLVRAGAIDFPMARATIIVTVPSPAGSFKMARIGETVGAFTQDRAQGISGHLGAEAALTPLTVEVRSPDEDAVTRHRFEIVRSAGLTGGLTQLVMANTLFAADRAAVSGTIRLSGQILVAGREPVPFAAAFAGGLNGLPVALPASGYVASLMSLFQQAAIREDRDLAMTLRCDIDAEIRSLRVTRILLATPTVAPGGTVQATAILTRDSDGTRIRQPVEMVAPDLPPGTRLQLLVGDALAVARASGRPSPGAGGTITLDRLAAFVEALHAPERLYARLSRPATGLVVNARPLADLPPSVAAILGADGGAASHPTLGLSEVATGDWAQDGVVRGSMSVMLTVR
ncbi:MAG: hypothetical protein ACE5IK_08175 [Acidobacteriota bacterium]